MERKQVEGFTLGQAIRSQRELARIPLRQLATMVGISNPYLSQIERGLREPSEQVLDAIAESLRVSADVLGRGHSADSEDEFMAALRSNRRLTAPQRLAITEIYSAFLEANNTRRRASSAKRRASEPSPEQAGGSEAR